MPHADEEALLAQQRPPLMKWHPLYDDCPEPVVEQAKKCTTESGDEEEEPEFQGPRVGHREGHQTFLLSLSTSTGDHLEADDKMRSHWLCVCGGYLEGELDPRIIATPMPSLAIKAEATGPTVAPVTEEEARRTMKVAWQCAGEDTYWFERDAFTCVSVRRRSGRSRGCDDDVVGFLFGGLNADYELTNDCAIVELRRRGDDDDDDVQQRPSVAITECRSAGSLPDAVVPSARCRHSSCVASLGATQDDVVFVYGGEAAGGVCLGDLWLATTVSDESADVEHVTVVWTSVVLPHETVPRTLSAPHGNPGFPSPRVLSSLCAIDLGTLDQSCEDQIASHICDDGADCCVRPHSVVALSLLLAGGADYSGNDGMQSLNDSWGFTVRIEPTIICQTQRKEGKRVAYVDVVFPVSTQTDSGSECFGAKHVFPHVNGHVCLPLPPCPPPACLAKDDGSDASDAEAGDVWRSLAVLTAGKDRSEGSDSIFVLMMLRRRSGSATSPTATLLWSEVPAPPGSDHDDAMFKMDGGRSSSHQFSSESLPHSHPHWRYTPAAAAAPASAFIQTMVGRHRLSRVFFEMALVGGNCRHSEGPETWLLTMLLPPEIERRDLM